MLITLEDLDFIWKLITGEAMKGGCSTMIFVANNCDALAACKILTDLLKQYNIVHTSVPVFSYSDIENNLKEDVLSSDIKSLIFLNCGAKLDFTQYWFNQKETDIKTFVFESLRPVSHNNVLTQKAVYVIDDGDIDLAECPEDADIEAMEEEMEAEGEDNPVDGEKEYQLIINGGKDKQEEQKDYEAEGDQEAKEGEGDDFDTDLLGKKRKRDEDNPEDKAEQKKKSAMRVTEYYSGNKYAKCCAYLVYKLGVQLNKQTVESFWLWILGLTDQLLHSKITSFEYDDEIQKCQKDYLSIINQNYDQENEPYMNNHMNQNGDNTFDSKGLFYQNVDLDTENVAIGKIIPRQEFRFMFLRSWTLYKSIFYSNYVVSKLKLWQDLGKRELNRFFARLGIPATEYNQQYKFMSSKYKDVLQSKITEIAPDFDLKDISITSFVRQIDKKTQMNASDMVHAVTSLLEAPRNVMIDNIPQLDDKKDTGLIQSAEEEEQQRLLSHEHTKEMQIENFWAAYRALDIKNTDYIKYGVALAKEMQMALVSQGTSLITNRKVMPCTKFRYSIISNDSLGETKIFQYPMAIQKLALFIMEAYKESKRNKEEKPMVLCIKNSVRDSYLISAVLGRDARYTRNKNVFGDSFQEAAEKIGAKFKYDSFESSLIEIKSENFEEFMDEVIHI